MKSTVGQCIKWVAIGLVGTVGLGLVGSAIGPSISNLQTRENSSKINQKTVVREPEVLTITEKETEIIPHGSETVNDNTLASGTTVVRTAGVDGERTKTYSVTYTDGVETDRKLVSTEITKEPVTEIIVNGTYVYVAPQQTTQTSTATNCPNGYYTNSAGNVVCRPSTTQVSGATAVCRDGTYSYSQSRRGTCSHHGGVAQWL